MKTYAIYTLLFLATMTLLTACKSSSSDKDEPTPSGNNSFMATVDGKSWKATKVNGGVAVAGGLLSIVGKLDDANDISIQMIGKDIETGKDYQFEIPATDINKNANLIYKKANSPLLAQSGKVRLTTYTNKKIEGQFEAQVSDFINATTEIKTGTFTINF